ncbi:T9SS type A sorting domain-containing protein [Aquimarina brevivitae]|uniref:Putative secreted protein (Por secretion system target) n=1 Tax=Aquimarina brevivitae TaxID=323412 RepID=A0A4V2F4V1_9FLAO|nr:T9SS type A sorting domain-containing protein [Aquimarina brevivitae]RZS90599.1 putative secreted protein (Por secretion system target) [Aquimarina brevivitae]
MTYKITPSFFIGCFLFVVTNTSFAQLSNRSYIFGHSLVNHSADQTTQNRSNIPDWLHLLAEQAGNDYAVDGQFNFLPFQQLPPIYHWSFIDAQRARTDESNTDFGSIDYDNVIVTLANFIQPSSAPSDNAFCDQQYINNCNEDPNALSSVEAVVRILDFARQEEPTIDFYIYENWPEFYGTFPPTSDEEEATEFGAFYDYTRGDFHNWWIDLQDEVLAARPDSNVKLIPVGPILADLFSDTGILADIPAATLYEDAAPHGYPVVYFLTALIHYSVLYGEQPPADFQFPDENLAAPIRIPDLVKNNYNTIVSYIWDRLQDYTFASGESRVFVNDPTLSVDELSLQQEKILLYPNPGSERFMLRVPQNTAFPISLHIVNTLGQLVENISITDPQLTEFRFNKKGTFFVNVQGEQFSDTIKMVVQ